MHIPHALPFFGTGGIHDWATGWAKRGTSGGEVAGIIYSLCVQENAVGLSTAGERLEDGE